jgi:carboxyl-terminal processing protease
MENKGLRTCLTIVVSIIVLTGVFLAGAGVGYFTPQLLKISVPSGPAICPPCPESSADAPQISTSGEVFECPACPYIDPSGDTPEEYQQLFAPFWETWEIVHEDFVDQPVDDLALMRGAIEGMLGALGDKHTSYMNPDEFKQASESLEGEYEGIGAWVDTSGEYVEIVSPMKDSPAARAGLQPKDQIIAIGGEDMTGIPGDLVLQRILGPAGSEVNITIRRGVETFEVTLIRENILVPTVEYEMLEDDIAYVALLNYGSNTTDQLRSAFRELFKENPVGLIFDLRNNGGGYLDTAIQVVSEFIPSGVVMFEQYGGGETYTYNAIQGGLATKIPLTVLVNEGTASASEITAGAIQDLERAPLVGMTTYGKGSVQNWVALKNDAGGVRVTIARWLTPNGRQIAEQGLTPDYIVEMTEDDYINGLDPQLEKAIDVLKKIIQDNQ